MKHLRVSVQVGMKHESDYEITNTIKATWAILLGGLFNNTVVPYQWYKTLRSYITSVKFLWQLTHS